MKKLMWAMLSFALFIPWALLGQIQSARVEGTVIDSSSAVIPGAKVSMVNTRTQQKLDATADGAGYYLFPSVVPGPYTLTGEAQGFRKSSITNLEVNIGVSLRQEIKLEIGSVAESLTVEASSVTIQTNDATIQRAVTLRDIDTLPQLARGPIALATFQPGVQLGTNNNDPSFARINGMRQGSNNNTLDGIDVNDAVLPRLGLTMNANNTDSVEEFRIITNGAKAEYGRNAGGTVELITRSGTNEFHGNLFEYHRNTVLNANNFFNKNSGRELLRPKFIQNQYGGSIGGPVLIPKLFNGRDKLFFFYNFQGTKTAQEVVRNRTVLTPQAKSGIFRWNQGGATREFNILQADPRRLGIDRVVAGNLALLPNPNNTDLGDGFNTAGFRFNAPANGEGDQHTFKTDWQARQNIRTYFRYSWFRTLTLADSLNNAEATFPGQPNGTQGGVRNGYSVGMNWTISPTVVNEFLIGTSGSSVNFGRVRSLLFRGQALIASNLFTDPIPTAFSSGRYSPVNPQISNNLTLIRGKHTFKTGFRFSKTLQNAFNDGGIFPNITTGLGNGNAVPAANGPAATDIDAAARGRYDLLYNDLLGRVSTVAQTFYSDLTTFRPGEPRVRNFLFRDLSFYFQDDWRIGSKLTLNIGLRHEYFGLPTERDGLQGRYVQAFAGQVNTLSQISDMTIERASTYFKNDRNNFAPRFGFAYAANSKTSIRGSWGMFYDRIIGGAAIDPDGNTPGFAQSATTFPNSTAGADNRVSDASLSRPTTPTVPVVTPLPNRAFGATNIINPDLRTPYVLQMNFTIQRELTRNTVMEAGYVSNRGIKLLLDHDLNQTRIYSSGFLSDFRELQAFQANNTPVSGSNNIARIYGGAAQAITAIGANPVRQGAVGAAANTVDTTGFSRFQAAGVSPYYLRNFPQFTQVWYSTNLGRSAYDSLQISIRRQQGALKGALNYTWSKTIDNASVDGSGNTALLDSYNLKINRAISDINRPHTLNWVVSYTLPIGRGRLLGGNMPEWVDKLAAGWEVGSLGVITSGAPMSITSGILTGSNQFSFGPFATNIGHLVDYRGTDRSIGKVERVGNGVRFFTPEQVALFSVPQAGSIGNSGRNAFTGPGFFNTDLSLVKRFRIVERKAVTFRAEAYNLLNTVNFLAPGLNLQTPATFGTISGTPTGAANQSGARILQGALRFDF
jgi:hypothetical protein